MQKYINSHMFDQNSQNTIPTKTKRSLARIAKKTIRLCRYDETTGEKRREAIRATYRMKIHQQFGQQSNAFMTIAYDILDSFMSKEFENPIDDIATTFRRLLPPRNL